MSEKSYRRSLRSAVRGLWNGVLNQRQALQAFSSGIERGISRAWDEGAAECNIAPDELTIEELVARDDFITEQISHARSFLKDVNSKNKANGGKLRTHYKRLEMWVNQYSSAKQKSEAMACADQKRMWTLGKAEHCKTCLALNGKVKRMSFWLANVLPRNAPNEKLECRGFNCQCTLIKTDKPISRGPLPALARKMMSARNELKYLLRE